MALNLYPPSAFDVYNQIKLHYSSSIDAACDHIRQATRGVGTNEKTLIKVLGDKSPNERALIAYRYKELYKESLKDLLESETGGDFGYLLQLLVRPLPEAEAYILKSATEGAGTTESLIYPIILGRSNKEITVLKKTYFELYGQDLAVMLDNDLSGDFKKVILSALQAPVIEFNPAFHTEKKAEEDAEKLYQAGEGKWGTDEEGFLKVLLSSPRQHLEQVNAIYTKKHKSSIKTAAQKEFTGIAETSLVFFIRLALEPKEQLAELLESTMSGIGTDERGLSAALVRYHAYLGTVASTYQLLYKSSLKDRIKGEVGGDFGELLVKVIDAPTTAPASA